MKGAFLWLQSSWEELNFRQKLSVAFVTMTLLPLLLGSGLTEWETSLILKRLVFERNHRQAVSVAQDFDELITGKIKVLKMIAGEGRIQTLPSVAQTAVLENLVRNYQELQLAVLTDAKGRQLNRSDRMSFDPPLDYSGQPYFQSMLQRPETTVSSILTAKSAGWRGIVVAEPVLDSTGELKGAILGKIGLASLQLTLQKGLGHPDIVAYVVNQEGLVIIHSDNKQVGMTAGYPAPAPLLQSFSRREGWLEYRQVEQNVLAGFATINSTGWKLVVEQPVGLAMAEVWSVQRLNFAVILLAVVLAVMVSLLTARTMSDAVRSISEAANHVSDGDFSVRLKIRRSDEIGELADNFNRMTSQLAGRTEALRASEEKFHSLVDNINIGVYRATSESPGRFLQINPAMVEIFGYPSTEELLQVPLEDLYNKVRDWQTINAKLHKQGFVRNQEVVMRKYDGSPIWCSRSAVLREDKISGEKWIDGVIEDVTERKQADEELRRAKENLEIQVAERTRELTELNKELQRMSLSDGLTGIANRRYLDLYLEREWQRAIRDRLSVAAIMVDIDHFKLFNDTYGHLTGDECLVKVAAALQQTAKRPADFAARYGGEEFALILPETDLAGALVVAEKMRAAVEMLQIRHEKSPIGKYVTVSAGVTAMIPTEGVAVQLLLDLADQALYRAKKSGRNRVMKESLDSQKGRSETQIDE